MKFKAHIEGIIDHETWRQSRPPKEGDKQWVDGRSAKELAKYMTKSFPSLPHELEAVLCHFTSQDAELFWDAEHVTPLPEKGEGRNHDAILFNKDILVTIEAKADEPLGNLVEEELASASVNKLQRISTLLTYLFKMGFKGYRKLRYQLITASVGTILEAEAKKLDQALLLVLVFKTNGNVEEEKLARNSSDIKAFLEAVGAYDENSFKIIPNKSGIKLYFKEIVI